MSLINKMLQDLDSRASGGASSAVQQDEVKSVPSMERDRRPVILIGVAAGVLVIAAGGWYGWQYWQAHQAPPPAPPPQPVRMIDNRMPDTTARIQEVPVAKPVEAVAPKVVETKPEPEAEPVVAKPKRPAPEHAERAEPVRQPKSVATSPAADGVVLRELTPKQASENSYRRALVSLQEGRVSSALADLDRAVEIDPRNEAARQTYVSLLLENRRTDDAIRQLRLALGIDPRQPGLAIILARLQLEKGGPALDTLLKTLPYAGNSSDYHAFLAGVLQREQRHAEAADHYRAALQLAPQNGVWWMGLGISLQADQHLPEAREAYNRARSAGGLTPDLRNYVDRQIDKLSH
ncbi:tetratricopeptide repeat protein [Duganella sp. FT135W]|uniref:Tetratricopeptide repeat protein n=1 Tax=Duganella flavida TaxID=2692175 RepID=A0A6L8KF87_9BURK|nr:tetratricopeptide repeat protein [Duganella flavida]MYM26119.1 tetratricopeptide repeat protein [Duganella flavida]